MYHQGWTAATKHRTPWKADEPGPLAADVWELYGPDDWTQAKNIATENPQKLVDLQPLWLIEATKYNAVPLDDRGFERINPDIAGRPQLITGKTQVLFQGMRVSEGCVVVVENKSHAAASSTTSLPRTLAIPAGKHQVRMEFKYDRGGLAKGGDVTLYCDGKAVGKGGVEKSQPMGYSADEACDVGGDADRHRGRRSRSPDHRRGQVQDRDGAAVTALPGQLRAVGVRLPRRHRRDRRHPCYTRAVTPTTRTRKRLTRKRVCGASGCAGHRFTS